MELEGKQRRIWAEIDLDAAEHNFKLINEKFERVCCVVKANAYGHGAIQLSRLYEKLGAAYLAVSNLEEAIQLRNAGIRIPIMILGYTPVSCVEELSVFNLTQCVYSSAYAEELHDRCAQAKAVINVHLKLDTGMGRIGFQYHDESDELDLLIDAARKPFFRAEGVFTHFAAAEEDEIFTKKQHALFLKACERLRMRGIPIKIAHCSNSAAIVNYPDFSGNMVRAGIVLYGIAPSGCASASNFLPILTLKSVVSNSKLIKKGYSVSYGREFIACEDTPVITISAGYADGFFRSNTNNWVFVNGRRCRIIGKICMDQFMAVCKEAKIGDVVELYGNNITVNEVASFNKTIPYEILCAIAERVPRVFLRNGKVVEIVDKLA